MDIVTLLGNNLGGIAAAIPLAGGLVQFVHQNAIRRYEKFHEVSVRFDKTPEIQTIIALLRHDDAALARVPCHEKEVFICFMEEILMMMQSNIMKKDVAIYTFGYYAKLASKSKGFWEGLERNNPFYALFVEFCDQSAASDALAKFKATSLRY